jgi:hypothetical protein
VIATALAALGAPRAEMLKRGATLRPGWGSRRCAREAADRCRLVGRRLAPPIRNTRANQNTRVRSISSIRSMDCPLP